jgi:endonuclease/exonuclease/phosphatase family metal-dependent hydrolase
MASESGVMVKRNLATGSAALVALATIVVACGDESGSSGSTTSNGGGGSGAGVAGAGGGGTGGGVGVGGTGGGAPVEPVDCVAGAMLGGDAVCNADNSQCSYLLRVMHYNVHALPETLSGENPKDRMRRIGEILAERRDAGTQPDFVLLQEAFDKVDRIIDRAGYAYVVQGPTQPIGLDGGLYILSDHPVVGQDKQSFDACADVDCFAEKGVLAISTQVPAMPEPIVIITTHLQAQSENDAVRIQQIDEMLPYLAAQNIESNASVFAGDFNFKAKPDHDAHPSYQHFIDTTPYIPAGKACLDDVVNCSIVLEDATKSDEADVWFSTNDHQFYYASSAARYRLSVRQFEVTFTEDFEGDPLSDHWAREADYCFTWEP